MKNKRNTLPKRLAALILPVFFAFTAAASPQIRRHVKPDLVFVRVPAAAKPSAQSSLQRLPADRYVEGCGIFRLDLSTPGGEAVPLTGDFHSALDPAVSFDGRTILFAGKRNPGDPWQVWRMDANGGNKKKVTQSNMDAVSPLYIGSLFHLDDKAPSRRIAYVGGGHLTTCGMDGADPQRITFNTSPEFSPGVLPNGRIIYSTVAGGGENLDILAVNIDGTDHMGYLTGGDVPGNKEMARIGPNGRIYFIQTGVGQWLGGGSLASVETRRPAHSYRLIGPSEKGYYHTPCPLPGGGLAVSYRAKTTGSLFSIYRLETGAPDQKEKLYGSEGYHCVDTQVLAPHPVVKGRSSFVDHTLETGVLYCIDVYISREPGMSGLPPGSVKSVQVSVANKGGGRILGSAPVEPDGSFHIRVPAKTPLTFKLIDKTGREVGRQVSPTWVMPRESRGCIGCHEDSELAPPNQLPQALVKPAVTFPRAPGTTGGKKR